MKNYLMIGAGLFTLAASGYAVAGPGMEKMDADDDGSITRAEATMASDKMFLKMDVNKDGAINDADREARKREKFAEIDANSDGQVTAAEMSSHHEAKMAERREKMAERREKMGDKRDEMFAKIDADGNGALSYEEFDRPHDKMRDGKGKRGEGRHGAMRGGKHMLGLADADKDGSISAEEARAAALERFDRADSDNDGVISEAERKAARKARWEMRKEAREASE